MDVICTFLRLNIAKYLNTNKVNLGLLVGICQFDKTRRKDQLLSLVLLTIRFQEMC